mmetsp:Transcript_17004/g.68576  ORF Transcript_17004/g.68576 Transcript_17004/m.68576 type:complete len:205 (+) Transcript_17004:1344-1958(+)
MRDVRLFHAQARGADEALVLRRFSRKVVVDKGHFVHDALPRLIAALARRLDAEHLVVRDGSNFRNRDGPLARLLGTFLFDRIGENLGAGDALAVEEVRGERGVFRGVVVVSRVRVALLVHFDRLPHRRLLLEPLLVVQLGANPVDLASKRRLFVDLARLLLPLPLGRVEPLAVPLAVQLDVLVLRHGAAGSTPTGGPAPRRARP